MKLDYTKIPAIYVIEKMRQDYLKMQDGEEKEKLLQHILAIHSKLNKLFYTENLPNGEWIKTDSDEVEK